MRDIRLLEKVLVIRLAEDADRILGRPFSEYQRDRCVEVRGLSVDAGRVAVVVEAHGLEESGDLLQKIAGAASVKAVILVVVGEVGETEQGWVVKLPREVREQITLMLWVGDSRGVLWSMTSASSSALVLGGHEATEGRGLYALLSALEVPEVFDAVTAASERLRSWAACPAVRTIVVGTSNEAAVASGESLAVQRLASGAQDTPLSLERDVGMEEFSQLLGDAVMSDEAIDPSGQLGQLISRARTSVDGAVAATSVLRKWPPRRRELENARGAVSQVGHRLDELRDEVHRVFSAVDGSDGLKPEEVEVLTTLGVSVGGIGKVERDEHETAERLLRLGRRLLTATRSLEYTAIRLIELSRKARPRNSLTTVQRLNEVLPIDLICRLKTAPAVDASRPGPLLLTAIGVVSFFSGLWRDVQFVAMPTVVVAVLLLLTVMWTGSRVIEPDAVKMLIGSRRRDVFAVLVAAATGGGVGILVAYVWTLPRGAGLVANAVSLIFVLVGVIAEWRGSLSTWERALELDGTRRVIDQTKSLITETVLNDWLLANPRVRVAEQARILAACLQHMRTHLLTQSASTSAPSNRADRDAGLPSLVRTSGNVSTDGMMRHAGEVSDIITDDYLELVMRAIDDCWAEFVSERDGAKVADQVEKRFVAAIEEYRVHLMEYGILTSPSDKNASIARRERLFSTLWSNTAELREVLDAEPTDAMVQLVRPELLRALTPDVAGAIMIRFAPEAARVNAERTAQVVWTEAQQIAGVLRLVPVRLGALSE